MRLRRLVLRDFGVFRGEQTLDLSLREGAERRPIVLIGGNNGAGKTTVLEAIRTCLHGRLALGTRVSEKEYKGYLRDRLHRGTEPKSAATSASVALEFDYSHLGRKCKYFVERAWELQRGEEIREDVRVLRDENPIGEMDAQIWPDFVRSLIPAGVAQLFFFDGEKIKRLAEEESEAAALGDLVKALLGLDLVERLRSDLDVFTSKRVGRSANAKISGRVRELELEKKRLHGELSHMDAKKEKLQKNLDDLAAQAQDVEEKLAQGGAGLASHRKDLLRAEAETAAEIAATQKDARDLLDGSAPFLLCWSTVSRLVRQLNNEHALQSWDVGQVQAKEALLAIRSKLDRADIRAKLGAAGTSLIRNVINDVENNLAVPPEQLRKMTVLHGMSDQERQDSLQTVDLTGRTIARRASTLAAKLMDLDNTLSSCRQRLTHMPEAVDLAPIVSELSAIKDRQAKIGAELSLLAERRARLQREISVSDREHVRLNHDVIAVKDSIAQLSLAARAKEAASDYLHRLTAAKIAELEREALESFRRLSRKENFVHRLTIDPRIFAVCLYDGNGGVIPKSTLSAGEKQIYAISMLWGMARVSGRPLPMIVDTPLGRLDSRHRANLIRHFLPAAHQVIVLSTDTEVDRSYYEQLRPHVSRAYRLVDRRGWTEAEEGYFWEAEHVDTHA